MASNACQLHEAKQKCGISCWVFLAPAESKVLSSLLCCIAPCCLFHRHTCAPEDSFLGSLSCYGMIFLLSQAFPHRPGCWQSWHHELLIHTAGSAGRCAARWEQPDFLCRRFNGAMGNESVSYGEGFFPMSLTIRIQPKILCVLPLRWMSSQSKLTCRAGLL